MPREVINARAWYTGRYENSHGITSKANTQDWCKSMGNKTQTTWLTSTHLWEFYQIHTNITEISETVYRDCFYETSCTPCMQVTCSVYACCWECKDNAIDGIVWRVDAGYVERTSGTPCTLCCRHQTLSSCCLGGVWMAETDNSYLVHSFMQQLYFL